MEPVPVAKTLGLTCPVHDTPLEDAIGPFWCPAGEHHVSAWTLLWKDLDTLRGNP